jgi:hypothetical protein
MPREFPIFPLPLVLFPAALEAVYVVKPRYRPMCPQRLSTLLSPLARETAAGADVRSRARRNGESHLPPVIGRTDS